LKEHEKNYATHDLELASIVHAPRMWRHYLMGNMFGLNTYHHILEYLFDHTQLNSKQSRWIEFLSEFNFEIKYIKGKENKVADTLNKRSQIMQISTISNWKSDLKIRL